MRLTAFLALAAITVSAIQLPLPANPSSHSAQEGTLAAISAQSETITLTSTSHPNHRVRIKAHDGWCEPSARSYTGYIDSGNGKELFFYFFESRSKPEKDPVVMWINGGPGASSAMGLFMELGPCRVKENPQSPNDTYVNPYAWNEKANVFFLDQPIGVGFSHGDYGQVVDNTKAAAKDVAAFIAIFFDTFKEYEGRAFHMTGESYGGRYLPVFASEVYDQNALLVKQGKAPINLKTVMIGNGGTNFLSLYQSSYEFMCTKHIDLGRTVLDINDCIIMAEAIPRCIKMVQKYCYDSADYTTCQMWDTHCAGYWTGTALLASVNWYNVNETCSLEERKKTSCLPGETAVETYLNLESTRTLLGVDSHIPPFKSISYTVNRQFAAALDDTHRTYYYVANLLERGIKVLNYVGTLEAACDHIGQSKWTAEMPWTGREGFLAAPTVDWLVDGEVAGTQKNYGDFTLLKIFGAGHLVPTDRPKEALAMFGHWIDSADK